MTTAFEMALHDSAAGVGSLVGAGRSRARKNPVSGGTILLGVVVLAAAAGGGYLLYENSKKSSSSGSSGTGNGAPGTGNGTVHGVGSGIYPIPAHVGDIINMTVPGTGYLAPTVVPSTAVALTNISIVGGNTVFSFTVNASGIIYVAGPGTAVPNTIATVTVS